MAAGRAASRGVAALPQWMIYGANGYTGELIAREAVRRGLRPVLAGRSHGKIAGLSGELGLAGRSFELTSRKDLEQELVGMHLVLNCAGPFSATARPMIESCLASKTHYLDITAEVDVLEFSNE